MIHDLKTDPLPFAGLIAGTKTFELRRADRLFAKLDVLHLRETRFSGQAMAAGQPLEYTGREVLARVVGRLDGPAYGLADGWTILSIVFIDASPTPFPADLIAGHDWNATVERIPTPFRP